MVVDDNTFRMAMHKLLLAEIHLEDGQAVAAMKNLVKGRRLLQDACAGPARLPAQWHAS